MKIMILQTAYKKAEDYGTFYNVQELGLARALASKGHEVILYKALDGDKEAISEYDGRLTTVFMNVKYIGINGLINVEMLDKTADVLIYFCDTQIKVPKVYKWCRRNNVRFFPYIGVIESHSEKLTNRIIMGFVARRNLALYRKCLCLGKTPDIIEQLHKQGCNNVVHFPVGLDTTILHGSKNYLSGRQQTTGDNENSPCRLLFIGRMEEEKHPLEMVEIFEELLNTNKDISLTMIGDGYLFEKTEEAVNRLLKKEYIDSGQITLLRKVPYNQMYEYYVNADIYINLNRVEILGMSILEAMYYGCGIVAIKAPGPCLLLEADNCTAGTIVPDKEGVIGATRYYLDKNNADILEEHRKNAYKRVCEEFCWNSLSDRLVDIID